MDLTYIVVHTTDLAGVRDWYVTHLDLHPEWESEAFVRLVGDDGAALGIHEGTPVATPEAVHLHFEVADVDATYDRLQAALAFEAPPQDTDWGHRVITTHDPAGHTVELYTLT